MIATAFLKNHMPLGRYQLAEHYQSAVNLTKARVGFVFLPSSAKDFVHDGVVLRTPGFSIGPLDTFARWSRGNVDPLVDRILSLLTSACSTKSGGSCERHAGWVPENAFRAPPPRVFTETHHRPASNRPPARRLWRDECVALSTVETRAAIIAGQWPTLRSVSGRQFADCRSLGWCQPRSPAPSFQEGHSSC